MRYLLPLTLSLTLTLNRTLQLTLNLTTMLLNQSLGELRCVPWVHSRGGGGGGGADGGGGVLGGFGADGGGAAEAPILRFDPLLGLAVDTVGSSLHRCELTVVGAQNAAQSAVWAVADTAALLLCEVSLAEGALVLSVRSTFMLRNDGAVPVEALVMRRQRGAGGGGGAAAAEGGAAAPAAPAARAGTSSALKSAPLFAVKLMPNEVAPVPVHVVAYAARVELKPITVENFQSPYCADFDFDYTPQVTACWVGVVACFCMVFGHLTLPHSFHFIPPLYRKFRFSLLDRP